MPPPISISNIHSDLSAACIVALVPIGSCEQEIYEFVEKEFEGTCVGIFTKNTRREYVDGVNDISGEQFIHTELKEPIQVAKVFYGNNKSKIVPIDKVGTWQSPF